MKEEWRLLEHCSCLVSNTGFVKQLDLNRSLDDQRLLPIAIIGGKECVLIKSRHRPFPYNAWIADLVAETFFLDRWVKRLLSGTSCNIENLVFSVGGRDRIFREIGKTDNSRRGHNEDSPYPKVGDLIRNRDTSTFCNLVLAVGPEEQKDKYNKHRWICSVRHGRVTRDGLELLKGRRSRRFYWNESDTKWRTITYLSPRIVSTEIMVKDPIAVEEGIAEHLAYITEVGLDVYKK